MSAETLNNLAWTFLLLITGHVKLVAGISSPPPCFSAHGLVEMFDGSTVNMKDLSLGDHVNSVQIDGNPGSASIWWNIHWEPLKMTSFIRLQTSMNATIEMTDRHLIPTLQSCEQPTRKATEIGQIIRFSSRFAEKVAIGDCLLGWDPKNKNYFADRVEKIETFDDVGYFSPVTDSGTLIVNNIVVSCYSQIENHALSHYVFYMLRKVASWFNKGRALISNKSGEIPYGVRAILHASTTMN